jgi:WD40 repeat protein
MTNHRPSTGVGLALLLASCGVGSERNPAGDIATPAPRLGNVRSCGTLGSDGVRTVVAMPDDETFVLGHASGRISFVSSNQTARPRVLQAHLGPIREVVVSPDGAWLASIEMNATLRLWDSETPTLRHEATGIFGVAFSRDSADVALVGNGAVADCPGLRQRRIHAD